MASAQWTGEHAKCKSMQEAKAILRHNDKARRELDGHANPHINQAETYRNGSYYGLNYEEKCRKFDRLVSEGLSKRTRKPGTGKNAPTLMQNIVVYEPADMQNKPDAVAKQWFNRVCDLAVEQLGDGLIDADYDFDEIHDYVDPDSKEKVKSRRHAHLHAVPLDDDGKLNGKFFSSRGRIVLFNDTVQEMTQKEFGMDFMDGTGKHGKMTVPELKAASQKMEIEMEADARFAEKKSALEDEKGEIALQMHSSDKMMRKSNRMLEKSTRKYRRRKISELDDREEELRQREREQNHREEEQNRREEEQNTRDASLSAREAHAELQERELDKILPEVRNLRENYNNGFTTLSQIVSGMKKEYDKLVRDPKTTEIYKIARGIFSNRMNKSVAEKRNAGKTLESQYQTIMENDRRRRQIENQMEL